MIKKTFVRLRFYWLPMFFLFTALSCNKDDDTPDSSGSETITAEEIIKDVMEEWYFWNDQLPDVNPAQFTSPNDYLNALLVEQDRWSFIANLDALLAFLHSGTYTGYGFSLKFDELKWRVKLVYDASPLKAEGITRGWKLVRINGQNISGLSDSQIIAELDKTSNSFVFENNDGVQKELNLTKQEMDKNTVLYQQVYDLENGKAGYLVFDSFLTKSEEELNSAFSTFQSEGVTELILDLRYNGGGSTNISNQLASQIAGSAYFRQVYSKFFHNNDKVTNNTVDSLAVQQISLDIKRVVIITTDRTASASEMVINGLKPYLDNVVLVGSKTHGKPVGMYVFPNEKLNLAVVPISFKIANANNEGDYFNGIPVDAEVTDDLSRDFGDMEEACLKAALEYIRAGSFEPEVALKAKYKQGRELPLKGFRELIGAF